MRNEVAVVVLAAGKGTRMKSDLPKVLHTLLGKPMIKYVLAATAQVIPERTVVVIGPDMPELEAAVAPFDTVIQKNQRGTGDAVKSAAVMLEGFEGNVLVVYGDTPLISAEVLNELLNKRNGPIDPAVVVLGFRPEDPGEYGRLIVGPKGELTEIVEYLECSEDQKSIDLCNSGVLAINGKYLHELLAEITCENAKAEYYLTDIIAIARSKGLRCGYVESDPRNVQGVNTRDELMSIEQYMRGEK